MNEHAIARFDEAMDLYMSAVFGGNNAWRSCCHRAARVAVAALKELYPEAAVRAVRVELLAYMDNGTNYAHIGCVDDRELEGQFPMHWAVQIDDNLYDPTFWQLRTVRTPLTLPSAPYFFAERWFDFARSGRGTDADVVTWVHDGAKPGLNVGYLVRHDELPPYVSPYLMPDEQARMHGRMVRVARGLKVPA